MTKSGPENNAYRLRTGQAIRIGRVEYTVAICYEGVEEDDNTPNFFENSIEIMVDPKLKPE